MAKLPLVVDKLDAAPENVRDLYIEADGKFRLDFDGEDPMALRKALENSRRVEKELERKVKRWEALGKSDEEIAELLRKHEERELTDAEKKGEWDKLRAQMNEKHAAELKARDDQLAKMRATLERYLVNSTATAEIAKLKGVPDLLLPHVQRNVRVEPDGDDWRVKVVDAKGDERVNGKGEPLTIADLVAEMRQSEVFGRAFEASGKTGSGTPANGSGGSRPKDYSGMKPVDKLTAARAANAAR